MSVPRRMAQAFSLHDEDGMTTVGMVVSLLLALSMIFSSAQVYRIQSVSSRVQSVADAGALAAGNVVAEFMVAVRVCDSVALSLSLTSLTSTGLGVVACCVPGGQGVGAKLLEAARAWQMPVIRSPKRFPRLDAHSEGPSVFGGGQRGFGCAGKRLERIRLHGACPAGPRFRRGYPGAAGRRARQAGSRRCDRPG